MIKLFLFAYYHKKLFYFKDLNLLYLSFLYLEKKKEKKKILEKLLGISFHFEAKNDFFNKMDFLRI